MSESLTVKVASAVADAEGVRPTELRYCLEEYIPMEKVEQLDAQASTTWTLSFELPDYEVLVTNDGTVFVRDLRQRSPT